MIFIVVIVIVLFVWGIYLEIDARRTEVTSIDIGSHDVPDLIAEAYRSRLFRRLDGSGMINFNSYAKVYSPTMSISWTKSGSTTYRISIWASKYTMRGIIILHPLFIWRMKRKMRKLAGSLQGSVGSAESSP